MAGRQFIKNVSYTLISNLISFGVSCLAFVILPRFMQVEEYGAWQLYLFYATYIGFCHFGWQSGMYLRYAGQDFESLDARLMAGQYYGDTIMQIVMGCFLALGTSIFVDDPVKRMVLYAVALSIPLVNFTTMTSQTLQVTNRIREYAIQTILRRLFFIGVAFSFIFIGLQRWKFVLGGEIFSLICVAVYNGFLCRHFLVPHFYRLRDIATEAYENISAGVKLWFADIINILIVGIQRYGISIAWDVATFGKISLTFGVSNFLMVFINAVSVPLFPMLKHIDHEKMVDVYLNIREGLCAILLGMMLGYYPLRCIIGWWLPKYADSLVYMAILFPVCFFESRNSLLLRNYLMSMRQEAMLLHINIASLIVSVLLAVVSIPICMNLDFAVLSIVLVVSFRCIYSEIKLQRLLGINLARGIMEELLIVVIFMISGWVIDNQLSMVIYGFAYVTWLFLHRRKLRKCWNMVRK